MIFISNHELLDPVFVVIFVGQIIRTPGTQILLQLNPFIFQKVNKSIFFLIEQQNSITSPTYSCSPSNPMHELVRILRRVHLYNIVHIFEIYSSCTYICTYQHSIFDCLEPIVYFFTFGLFHLSMHFQNLAICQQFSIDFVIKTYRTNSIEKYDRLFIQMLANKLQSKYDLIDSTFCQQIMVLQLFRNILVILVL